MEEKRNTSKEKEKRNKEFPYKKLNRRKEKGLNSSSGSKEQ